MRLRNCRLPHSLLLALFLVLSIYAQNESDAELRSKLAKVDAQLTLYSNAFKDFTATEFRVDEIFDSRGRLSRKKTVESDLVIVGSNIEQEPREYLVVRKVDGRPIRNSDRRAVEFLAKLARSSTSDHELDRLRNENFRHVIGVRFYGTILFPLVVTSDSLNQFFDFKIVGTEKLGKDEFVLIDYIQVQQTPKIDLAIKSPPELSVREAFLAGRIWVSPDDGKLVRLEERLQILSDRFTQPFTIIYREMEFKPSEFGLNFPARILYETYSPLIDRKTVKKTREQVVPGSRLSTRSTSTFGRFKKFIVEDPSSMTVAPISN
jgi:hypothetical protein